MRKAIPFVAALFLAACAAPPVTQKSAAPDVDPLAATLAQRDIELLMVYLEGTWETIPQAEGQGDSTPMRLRFARLWPERATEYWVYAEYVKAEDDRQPIRQRIFRFQRDGARVSAGLYRLPGDPAAYVGEWRKERPFAEVNPATLKEIEGCRTAWVKQMESLFAAGTEGNRCPGDRPETVDEHSDFYLASSSIRTWIRGVDASGKRVEGPSGPSEFRKIDQKLR
jgi:hypothetical protein